MIAEHRAAFEYDWRTRFGMALTSIGRGMTWGEAVRLVTILMRDPASAVASAMAGTTYPVSREFLVLADLFDDRRRLAGVKDAKPYPRPFERPGGKRRRGTPKPLSEAVALLNARGHRIKV